MITYIHTFTICILVHEKCNYIIARVAHSLPFSSPLLHRATFVRTYSASSLLCTLLVLLLL